MARIGLQLYTVRDEAERDFEGTLARIGSLGFEGVELHTLYGADAVTVRRWLDESGLVVAGRHAQLDEIERELDALAAELRALGTERLTISWVDPPTSAAAADALTERLVATATRARERGLQLGFHNHAGELAPLDDGRTFLDRLLAAPGGPALELDLGWAWVAGTDPVDLLAQARGRCPLTHVKDFTAREPGAFAPVGDGAVGYDRVLPVALEVGAEWLLVEQDETDGPAFAAVERSLRAVRRILGAPA